MEEGLNTTIEYLKRCIMPGACIKMPQINKGAGNEVLYSKYYVTGVYSHVVTCVNDHGQIEAFTWADIAMSVNAHGGITHAK